MCRNNLFKKYIVSSFILKKKKNEMAREANRVQNNNIYWEK